MAPTKRGRGGRRTRRGPDGREVALEDSTAGLTFHVEGERFPGTEAGLRALAAEQAKVPGAAQMLDKLEELAHLMLRAAGLPESRSEQVELLPAGRWRRLEPAEQAELETDAGAFWARLGERARAEGVKIAEHEGVGTLDHIVLRDPAKYPPHSQPWVAVLILEWAGGCRAALRDASEATAEVHAALQRAGEPGADLAKELKDAHGWLKRAAQLAPLAVEDMYRASWYAWNLGFLKGAYEKNILTGRKAVLAGQTSSMTPERAALREEKRGAALGAWKRDPKRSIRRLARDLACDRRWIEDLKPPSL